MAEPKRPSPQVLATLHYLQDQANFIRTYPATASEAVRLVSYFIRRLIGWEVAWPVPQISGMPGVQPPLEDVAGVTSIQPDALAVLAGAVRLLSGSGITLSEAGQDITIASSAGGRTILFDQTLGANAASIDTGAGGIAGTFDSLDIYILARTTEAVAQSGLKLTFNADSGANYDEHLFQILNAGTFAGAAVAQTFNTIGCPGASYGAGSFGHWHITLPAYRQTVAHKVWRGHFTALDTGAANCYEQLRSGRWRNTAAITRLAIAATSGNILAGSRLTVYGN
jgi:hypothetical protein